MRGSEGSRYYSRSSCLSEGLPSNMSPSQLLPLIGKGLVMMITVSCFSNIDSIQRMPSKLVGFKCVVRIAMWSCEKRILFLAGK